VREIRTLGLKRRGLETSLWFRHWGTPIRKRGATDQRNLTAARQSSTLRASSEGWRVQWERKPTKVKVRCLVAWIAGGRETKLLKPIDKAILGMVASHRAVTKVNAEVAP